MFFRIQSLLFSLLLLPLHCFATAPAELNILGNRFEVYVNGENENPGIIFQRIQENNDVTSMEVEEKSNSKTTSSDTEEDGNTEEENEKSGIEQETTAGNKVTDNIDSLQLTHLSSTDYLDVVLIENEEGNRIIVTIPRTDSTHDDRFNFAATITALDDRTPTALPQINVLSVLLANPNALRHMNRMLSQPQVVQQNIRQCQPGSFASTSYGSSIQAYINDHLCHIFPSFVVRSSVILSIPLPSEAEGETIQPSGENRETVISYQYQHDTSEGEESSTPRHTITVTERESVVTEASTSDESADSSTNNENTIEITFFAINSYAAQNAGLPNSHQLPPPSDDPERDNAEDENAKDGSNNGDSGHTGSRRGSANSADSTQSTPGSNGKVKMAALLPYGFTVADNQSPVETIQHLKITAQNETSRVIMPSIRKQEPYRQRLYATSPELASK